MSRTLTLILCFTLALACGSIAAAQPPPPPPGVPSAQPTRPNAAPDQPAPPRPEPVGQALNVRVELVITDQPGAGEPLKKTITMLAADRARSSVRNEVPARGFLNVDALPHILQSGAIRMVLGLEYMPAIATPGTETSRTLSRLNEQVTVVLESGKPLVISQAADPTSDRKVTVQVTATIVK
jgi:hypothetical protein